MNSKNTKALRVAIPLAVLVVVSVGFALHAGVGTLSALGWGSISVLCPLGALGTMLASKMLVPRAVISLAMAAAAIVLLGRAFCAWVCPVPVVSKLRGTFRKTNPEGGVSDTAGGVAGAEAEAPRAHAAGEPLTVSELEVIKGGCGAGKGCASCTERRGRIDSRHVILGGSLLTAAVFGFPVFCLVCPIGLIFATVLLVMLLFSGGDVTWSVVVVPLLLLAEVVLFRKWCSKICPLSAFMSLIGKANRTFRPAIDDAKCLETARGAKCGACAAACEQGIDPRHPERGADWSECTKCRACVEACPVGAIGMPFLPRRAGAQEPPAAGGAGSDKGREGRGRAGDPPLIDEDLPLAASVGCDE